MDVVLVLDSTGSMQGQKLDTLKRAARDLITHIYDQDGAREKVKFGIVPFAEYVNVGLSNRNEPWIDVPSDYSETNESLHNPGGGSRKLCHRDHHVLHSDGVSVLVYAQHLSVSARRSAGLQ